MNRLVRRLALGFMLLVSAEATVAEATVAEATVEEAEQSVILEANRATILALDSFDLTVEASTRPKHDRIKDFTIEKFLAAELVPSQTYQWFRSGDKERVIMKEHYEPLNKAGLPTGNEDVFLDGQILRSLGNWDWDDPQGITPTKQGSAYGHIQIQTSDYSRRDPAWFLQLYPRFQLMEPRQFLVDFVQRFSDKQWRVAANGDVRIRLKNDSLGIIKSNEHLDVTLSSDNGYLINRFVRNTPGELVDLKTQEKSPGVIELIYEVTSFQDMGGGAVLPTEVLYYTRHFIGDPVLYSRYSVKVNSVNEPLPDDTFEFHFPENLQVVDTSAGLGDHKWLLWGPNDQPAMEISNPADLRRVEGIPERSGGGSGVRIIVLLNAAVFLGVLGWLAYRRLYAHRGEE